MSASPHPLPPRPAVMDPYRPDWLEKPSADDMSEFYPAHAARHDISGKVKMTCQVKADGRLSGCRIDSETPKGEFFGEAALRLAPKFRMIPPDDLRANPGEVTVPLVFQVTEPRMTFRSDGSDARLLMQGGLIVSIVATALLAFIVLALGRYHVSATKKGSAKTP